MNGIVESLEKRAVVILISADKSSNADKDEIRPPGLGLNGLFVAVVRDRGCFGQSSEYRH